MFQSVNFCGASGQSYKFQRVKAENSAWTEDAGVVIFAASDGMSWRVIRVADQVGRAEDLNAIWRWREAQRYGATAIFVRAMKSASVRAAEAGDLVAGLNPVCLSPSEGVFLDADDDLPLAA
ncbi:MAG: hypothetical protein AAF719_02415 [Pseudomonadota bacterium]